MSLKKLDVVVVGAGFSGLYLLHKLRSSGFSVAVLEKADQLGGTWHWNRYPGARCDIPSLQYSYQFDEDLQQEWNWSEKYSAQQEILEYLNHVADRFDLKKDIEFNTEVISARFNEEKSIWEIKTSQGEVETKFCVMATGCLSAPNTPDFKGLDDYEGQLLHTGKWPQTPVDFTDESVAIIGTGSSSVQSIPIIAEQAKHLYVFQRTPNYSIPTNNGPMDPAEEAEVKSRYPEFRKENWENGFGIAGMAVDSMAVEDDELGRHEKFNHHWENEGLGFLGAYADLMIDKEANEMAASFARNKVKEIVKNPEVAELLSPKFTIGCKRLCCDSGYFESFNRDNVTLVDLNANPIHRITRQGLIVGEEEYSVDSLVLATGFDAMTGALTRIDIRGRKGISLKEQWKDGAKSYLGLGISNFPNLFTVTGPGSPSVLSNMVPSLELHVEWISQCIEWMRENKKSVIESTKTVEDEWMVLVNEVADQTVYKSCKSWYNGSNIDEKAKEFLPFIGVPSYTEKINEVAKLNYQGFVFDKTN